MNKKNKVLYFLLRTSEEKGKMITGGTWSSLIIMENLRLHQPFVIMNQCDQLLIELLNKRNIHYQIIKGEYPFIHFRKKSFLLKVKSLFELVRYNFKIFKICKREDDIKIFHCDEMSASMVFVGARLAKKKLVIYVRNYPRQGRLRWLYKFPMLFSDKVIAIGRELRDLIKEQSPPIIKEKVIHIYNALDIEESKRLMMNNNPDDLKQDLKIPKDKVIISIIALIGPIKRQKDFLKFVVSKIRDNRILFYFIGEVRDEGYMDECREVIREEKIKNVVFAGFFKEIWKWYLVTDILCLPSVREGVPRVLIEAGAYSIPTIAFNIPGNREVIIDNKTGYLVDDFKEFRLRLESLISDNILRKKMANEAQRYIASVFDARLTTNKLEKVYIELTRR